MKQTYISLTEHYIKGVLDFVRKRYLMVSGLRIKGGGSIGRIICKWPKSIEIGFDCTIQDDVRFDLAHPFSADNYVKIGDRVFIGQCSLFNCCNKIYVGNDTMIAANTTIVDVSHGFVKGINMNQQPVFSEEIIIGSDVWIGTGCIILKGVKIGNGSIVGAGSVVTKSIPEYQIWAGSPARFIRNRD